MMEVALIMEFVVALSTFFSIKVYRNYGEKIKLRPNQVNEANKCYILLPAFKEQSLVEETLNYYSKINKKNCTIVVITSEQEEYENMLYGKNEKTTKECVDMYLKKTNTKSIVHFHGKYTKGTKSTQLNFALQKIKNILNPKEYRLCYIGVYDFDSRPNLDVLEDLGKIIDENGYPEVVQQVPINTKNYKELAENNNCSMMTHCYQTMMRSVGIELAALLLNLRKISIPMYCMGAGMYIRLDTLLENNMFPEPIDDIALGYRLFLKGKKFGVLPNFNSVESPSCIRKVINQDVGIFKGVLCGLFELKQKSNCVKKISTICAIIYNIVLRTFLPWVYLFYIISRIFLLDIDVIVIMLVALPLVRTMIGIYIINKIESEHMSKMTVSNMIRIFIHTYLWRYIRTIGSFKCIMLLIKNNLMNIEQ